MEPKWISPPRAISRDQIPLLMFHGYGSNEADLFMLASDLPDMYYPIALRAPEQTPFGGYAWFPLETDRDGNIGAQEDDVWNALENLRERIAEIERASGGWHRKPALLGFSQGGMMALLLTLQDPARWSHTAALSTFLPVEARDWAPQGKKLPALFVSHGLYDDVIPVEKARQTVEELQRMGFAPVYKEYPAGHYLSEANIADLADWMAGQASPRA